MFSPEGSVFLFFFPKAAVLAGEEIMADNTFVIVVFARPLGVFL